MGRARTFTGTRTRTVRHRQLSPGAQRTPSFETRKTPPRSQQRVLHGIVGVLDRSEDPVEIRPITAHCHNARARTLRMTRSVFESAGQGPGREENAA